VNAERLPYEDSNFDIIIFSTVFTSILESTMKRNVSMEALRVLKSGGIIIYYDFFYDNPRNRDVRGVKKREIYELFPSCNIYLKRITLAPPLARLIAPYSYFACYVFEKLRIFNTHYLGLIRKK